MSKMKVLVTKSCTLPEKVEVDGIETVILDQNTIVELDAAVAKKLIKEGKATEVAKTKADEITELKEENEALKAEIAELKAEKPPADGK